MAASDNSEGGPVTDRTVNEEEIAPEWSGEILVNGSSNSAADDKKALLSSKGSSTEGAPSGSPATIGGPSPASSSKQMCIVFAAAVLVGGLAGFLAGAKNNIGFLAAKAGLTSPCNEAAWPDKENQEICGNCKVPVARFSYFYETCSHYCNIQGRTCVGGWTSPKSPCHAGKPIRCDETPDTDVAICQCSVEVSDALKSEFTIKANNKVNASCGKDEDDVDFWTDAPLAQVPGIDSSEKCRSICVSRKGCGAFTWTLSLPGLTNMCFLKKVIWGNMIARRQKPGVISGHPYADCKMFEPSHDHGPDGNSTRHRDAHRDAESDDFKQEVGDHLSGVVRVKRGLCLDSEWPHHFGSRVEMMTCNGEDSQEWKWDRTTGQLLNKLGLCLATDTFEELSSIHLKDCDTRSWNQQFSFKAETGTFSNWRGPCINADEYHRDHGAVFMRPCDTATWNQQFEMGALESMDIPTIAPKAIVADTSIYCFALMLPHTYEQGLLAMQFKARVSLFSCEAYTVYSNVSIEVAPKLTSRIINSTLQCGKGGEFMTALNLHIFIAVWKKVNEDAVYIHHDWTVKVDPDAVFFPQRLKGVVARFPESEKGVYLNNCKYGMHGPVEVFSRNAVITWTTGYQHCIDHFWQLCRGDCLWGEDLFIDQCLSKVLGTRRESDYSFLVEDHCDPPEDWQSCGDPSGVCFHPFKDPTEYITCLNNNARAMQQREGLSDNIGGHYVPLTAPPPTKTTTTTQLTTSPSWISVAKESAATTTSTTKTTTSTRTTTSATATTKESESEHQGVAEEDPRDPEAGQDAEGPLGQGDAGQGSAASATASEDARGGAEGDEEGEGEGEQTSTTATSTTAPVTTQVRVLRHLYQEARAPQEFVGEDTSAGQGRWHQPW